jgi:tRNA-Thr(GGU) m(6)t(6)A37 methyltransferase TsaA
MQNGAPRLGEVALPFDPAAIADASLVFIGHMATPWHLGHCPKNLTEARTRGGRFQIHLNAPYRDGLAGLAAGMPIIVLSWMAQARRDLIRQHPSHRTEPAGTFALRSPVRPNPIALAVVQVLAVDPDAGVLTIDASDAYDGTPVLDIKPWLPGVDIPPQTSVADLA